MLQDEIAKEKRRVAELVADAKTKDGTISKLKKPVTKREARIQSLQSDVDVRDQRISSLIADVSAGQGTISALNHRLSGQGTAIALLALEITEEAGNTNPHLC